MAAPTHPLNSLDAWPGESQRPALRLLEPHRDRSGPSSLLANRPQPVSWLQRLRRAITPR
jgi:hypothetical protein